MSSNASATVHPYKIAATIIVGAQPEPHFDECLQSVAEAVDYAVVDYNGHNEANYRALTSSQLYKEGRLIIKESSFTDYASARNRTLEMLTNDTAWFMRLDADEVHFPSLLRIITREILPNLSTKIGWLDAYWLCFFHSFKYVSKLEKRSELFTRFRTGMRWERSIHEQLTGLEGKSAALPYVFHHYACVKSSDDVQAKRAKYVELETQEPSLQEALANDPLLEYSQDQKCSYQLKDLRSCWQSQKNNIFLYNGSFPEKVDIAWRKDPNSAPESFKAMQEELEEFVHNSRPKPPFPQHGGKRRILFRLPYLLANLQNWEARRQAMRLASSLTLCLP